MHREFWSRLIRWANAKLTELSPAEWIHSSFVIEYQSVCFPKSYLQNPIMIEVVDYFRDKHYVATVINIYLLYS